MTTNNERAPVSDEALYNIALGTVAASTVALLGAGVALSTVGKNPVDGQLCLTLGGVIGVPSFFGVFSMRPKNEEPKDPQELRGDWHQAMDAGDLEAASKLQAQIEALVGNSIYGIKNS